ncbi:MAG: putative colanic acid biosynthesis acetyltransferase [Cytophagales bacterium]|nr:putative colanic acid biosynthesis acetyltransferase [Cytophagales bacterium]
MSYQDLSKFKVPQDFRGKPGWYVQLWWTTQALFFKPSPQILYGWRRFLLRLFGASIGKGCIIRPSAHVTYPWKVTIGDYSWIGDDVVLYSLGEIRIGKNAVVSQKSYLCGGGHDYEALDFPIYQKPIIIEDECWVATDVFVGPGVCIGKGAVIGARSSVFKNVEGGKVYMGNPLRFVKNRSN